MPNSGTERTAEQYSNSLPPPPISSSPVTETESTPKRTHSAQDDESEEDRLPASNISNAATASTSVHRPLRLVKRHRSEHNIRSILGADHRGEILSTQPSSTYRSASVSVLPDFRHSFLSEGVPEMDPRYDNTDSPTGGASLSSSSSSNVTNSARAARQRTAIACLYCRRRKIRCSGFDPGRENSKCTNCTRFNQTCIFAPVSSLTAPVRQVSVDQPHQPQQQSATPHHPVTSQQQPAVAPHAPPVTYAPTPYAYYGYQYGYYTPYDTSSVAGQTPPQLPPPPPPPSMMAPGYTTYGYMLPHYPPAAQHQQHQHPPPPRAHSSQQERTHSSQRSQSELHSQTLSRRPSAFSLRHLSLPDSSSGLPALSSTSADQMSTSAPPVTTQGYLESRYASESLSSTHSRKSSSKQGKSSSSSSRKSPSAKSEAKDDDAKKRGKMKISDLLE